MRIAPDWTEYGVIATGDGEKLERWGELTLLRPDPQIIWHAKKPLRSYKGIDAVYERSATGGGKWIFNREIDTNFKLHWRDLTFSLKLMGFKHTGLFPEQATNWDRMMKLVEGADRKISVLNLFGYTGAASVACKRAGADVCHVDGAKAMVERAAENLKLSGLDNSGMRYIVDDCFKFCARELRRGRKYDAIILDPPSFGRGPNGEKWKIEEGISELMELVAKLLSDKPLFVCLNSYTTGLQPAVMSNILKLALPSGAAIDSDEIGLSTDEGLILPQGCTAFAEFGK
ncbi:MAG: class I SAM-dependent methyltransferase [Firmicutes bacterium]|nr:class I SAM-dependent methyltransferase [Bacillota bacterium]MCM1394384.1 class I SAM-dependent methyltransferase [[Eubacterium] siraeum]